MNQSKSTTKKVSKAKVKKVEQEITTFVNENKGKAKIGLYVIGGLIVLFGIIWLTTRQPQMPADIKATIDSLTAVNKQLIEHQKQIDSTINAYEAEVDKVDYELDHIKEKTTIVREYYHEVSQQTEQYTPTQVDSFFKKRYNY
jgi:chromosome segregation ATPase